MNKKIAIIGYGVVGKAMVNMTKDHYDIRVKDVDKYYCYLKEEMETEGLYEVAIGKDQVQVWEAINECDLAIICVPTNMNEDGSCDTSIVEDVISKLETPVILIKSTIEPGTTDRLKEKYGKRICFSPEYAGESSYYTPPEYQSPTDMKQHPYVIIGGEREDRKYIIDLLTPVLGPTKKYFQCTAKEAEVIKYAENTFFATKITYTNELKKICDALDVDFYSVREGWLLDPRICPMHTMVFDDKPGWSGKCFPKDTCAFIKSSIEGGYRPQFLIDMIKSNARHSNKESMKKLPEPFDK